MQETSSKDFTVAIIGGGMCGLACAIGLSRAGINVKVFEAATKFDEIGAGVGLAPNALCALKGLGLLDTILKAINVEDVAAQTSFRFVGGTGAHEHIYDVPGADLVDEIDIEKKGFGIYRPTFLAALVPLIDPDNVLFVKRLTSTTLLASGQYCLAFSDGTTYNTDLVIGADGIKSTVRNAVIDPEDPNKRRVAFTNKHVYRGMVPVEALKSAGVKLELTSVPHALAGPGKLMVIYPIKNRTMVNVSASLSILEIGSPLSPGEPRPWVQEVDQQEFLDAFKDGWGSDASAVLLQMTKPSKWMLHTLYPPLESFVMDRIVLIGDAAHAMVPYLGAGVGQGFEDTYALCRLLAHPKVTKDTLSDVLTVYDNLRRPRANMVLEESLKAGDILHRFGPGGYGVQETRQRMKELYESEWHHNLWYYDLEREVSNALDRL